MSKINPNAFAFWAFFGCAGYLYAGQHGAFVGVTIALGLSVLASILP